MRTILVAILLCLLTTLVSADPSYPRRIIVENVKNYSSAGDPVVDGNGAFWKSLGLGDSNDYIDNWWHGTSNFVNTWYGFNLNNSVQVAPGIRRLDNFIPGVNATLIQYKLDSNKTYQIKLDNYNPARQFTNWFQYGLGNIVAMSVAPNVTAYYGGLSPTTLIETGHILSYGFWQQLKDGSDWSNPVNRERIFWESRYPAFQKLTSQGLVNPVTGAPINDQYIFLHLTFEDGSNGEAITVARNTLDKLTGERLTKTTTTMNSPVSTTLGA